MRVGSHNLFMYLLLALCMLHCFPVGAQPGADRDPVPDFPPTAYYFDSSLAEIARAALEQGKISLATKLIHILEETGKEQDLLTELAVSQARADDWPGSDHTLSLLRDHRYRAYVLSQTAELLFDQGRRLEAPGRLIEGWREAIQVRPPSSRVYSLRLLVEAAIRIRYRDLLPLLLDRFETEARENIQDYASAMSSFSFLNAQIGNIEEAIRLYRRIPDEAWAKYEDYGGEMGLNVPSPRPAIAAAYVRAGNPDAAWSLYAAMSTSREKQETLRILATAALHTPSLHDVRPLFEQIFAAANALSKLPRRFALVDLLTALPVPGALFTAFSDLPRYALPPDDEVQIRVSVAASLAWKHKPEARRIMEPVTRLLPQIDDDTVRLFLTVRYADALVRAGERETALRLLEETAEASLRLSIPVNRIDVLSRIAGSQERWKDRAAQIKTDRRLIREMQDNPAAPAPFAVYALLDRLIRQQQRQEAQTVLNLMKETADKYAREHRGINPFRDEIARYEAEIAGKRQPPQPFDHLIALSEALAPGDERRRARELARYVTQRLEKHQLKQALQALPRFPLSDDRKTLLNQELGLK